MRYRRNTLDALLAMGNHESRDSYSMVSAHLT